MSHWTSSANQEWENYCQTVQQRLINTETNPQEVLSDIRQHLEAELAQSNLSVITGQDVKKILDRLGLPDMPETREAVSSGIPSMPARDLSCSSPENQKKPGALGSFYIVLFGILLPAFAAAFELVTRICSRIFFDPLPSLWHILLFFTIPAGNLACYWVVKRNGLKHTTWIGFLSGLSMATAIFYTLWFLPLLPISGFALLAFGLGFCGLAPALSLIAALICRYRLRFLCRTAANSSIPCFGKGLLAGAMVILFLIVPPVSTLVGLNLAASENPATQARGIRWLRFCSDKDYLLKLCYEPGDFFNFRGFLTQSTLTPETIRGIYYRVTGQAFNTTPPKSYWFARSERWFADFDFEEGGDSVGGQLKNVSLVSSQMDGLVDADAVLGYLEWTMIFQNDDPAQQREARCQIQLPPGGVVSRLTLWIDGKESEAAFGSRSQTKAAYKQVVERRRDPVLVTTKGPDQVLLQCFPLNPRGGQMKVRLGITFPMELTQKETAVLQLPGLNEKNFRIPQTTAHKLWIESPGKMTAGVNLTSEWIAEKQQYALRGTITTEQLNHQDAAISFARNPKIDRVWASKEMAGQTMKVLQSVNSRQGTPATQKIVVVVDTSAAMKSYLPQIARSLENLTLPFDLDLILAADTVKEISLPADSNPSPAKHLANTLLQLHCQGGMDNMPALLQAWDAAAESPDGIIVWIHAAQPHLFEKAEMMMQNWTRRPSGPGLIHIPVCSGPNRIIEALDGFSQITTITRTLDIAADIQRTFNRLSGVQPRFELRHEQIAENQPIDQNNPRTNSHLMRLWGKEQVEKLVRQKSSQAVEKAQEIAVQYQLVTTVSGAVVLENQQQYQQHSLQPVNPDTVPTTPEPASLLLLATGVILLARMRRRK